MIPLNFSRSQLLSNLRAIRDRILKHMVIEQDLSFLLRCGILTLEEYQLMNGTKQEQVTNNPKVKEYTLNNDAH